MKFGKVQERKFGTSQGTYSPVTSREHFDSQITLTDYEAELVIDHFGLNNIHIGRVELNAALASKPFRLYPDGKEIRLNIVFPKPEKPELRLYISSRAGFKPDPDTIWFMYILNHQLWIGAMPESEWRSKSSELKNDETDADYQEALDETNSVRIAKLQARDIYKRDRNIALKRIELAGFRCEYDPNHQLFLSRFNQKPYLEAHHLVPLGLQGEFSVPLDTVQNVCSLCPYCHRAVHHAEEGIARRILSALAERRNILSNYGMNVQDLYSLYAIEEIE